MTARPAVTILDALGDPNLFAPWFRDPATWQGWRAFLAALFGLPMHTRTWPSFTAAVRAAPSPLRRHSLRRVLW